MEHTRLGRRRFRACSAVVPVASKIMKQRETAKMTMITNGASPVFFCTVVVFCNKHHRPTASLLRTGLGSPSRSHTPTLPTPFVLASCRMLAPTPIHEAIQVSPACGLPLNRLRSITTSFQMAWVSMWQLAVCTS